MEPAKGKKFFSCYFCADGSCYIETRAECRSSRDSWIFPNDNHQQQKLTPQHNSMGTKLLFNPKQRPTRNRSNRMVRDSPWWIRPKVLRGIHCKHTLWTIRSPCWLGVWYGEYQTIVSDWTSGYWGKRVSTSGKWDWGCLSRANAWFVLPCWDDLV